MSIQIREQITTNGLITYLDGAYSNSIISGSLVWKDITRQTADTPLINGANYSNTRYIGGVNFDGVDDYIAIPYRYLTTESFAAEIWYERIPSTVYLQGILTCGDNYGGATAWPPGWSLDYTTSDGSTISFGITDNTAKPLRWYNTSNLSVIAPFYKPAHVFVHRNTNTQTVNMFINGIKQYSYAFSNTISMGGANRNYISAHTWGYGSEVMTGTYYMIKIYHNYNFTDSEIVQKFTSTRERFGV